MVIDVAVIREWLVPRKVKDIQGSSTSTVDSLPVVGDHYPAHASDEQGRLLDWSRRRASKTRVMRIVGFSA